MFNIAHLTSHVKKTYDAFLFCTLANSRKHVILESGIKSMVLTTLLNAKACPVHKHFSNTKDFLRTRRSV